jgi:hypothetical protein
MRAHIAYTALIAAVVVAALGLGAPSPRRVNIRWAESVTLAQRVAAEQSLGLRGARPEEARTWSYEVPDASLIPGIITHPQIEDTHRIDRDRRAFSPELPAARASMRRVYESAPLQVIAAHWPILSGALLAIALGAAWPPLRAALSSAPDRVLIPAILAAALASRLVLVVAGGQFYWPDEDRYRQSRAMVEELAAGNARAAWNRATESAHPLFKALGLVPAAVEWTYMQDPRIPAAFFALFSVFNIWLLAGIARRLGAGAIETVLVALLFAASTSFLYFTRHLFPYDVAMTFGLLSLHAGSRPDASWRASIACGCWAALCFLAYFGYWTLGGAACVIHVLRDLSRAHVVRRGVLTAVGLATPLLLLVSAMTLTGGSLVTNTRSFMADVNQGTFAEGWRVPVEYLWHAEQGLLVLWIVAIGICIAAWRRWLAVPAVRAGLIGLLCVYGALAVFSTGLEAFVVYGRLARQLVPFLCLVTAAVLTRIAVRRPSFARAMLPAIAAAVLIQAAVNARQVFAQQFPLEFVPRGEQAAGRMGATRAVPLYTRHLYPPAAMDIPAGSVEAAAAPHPLQFRPYQYEGYTRQERQFLRSTDIRMRVLIPVGAKESG